MFLSCIKRKKTQAEDNNFWEDREEWRRLCHEMTYCGQNIDGKL
jgi:hypothetical protein